MAADFADGKRVTVLDLMAEAAASTPESAPAEPPPGPMSEAAPPEGGRPEELIERVERLSGELEGVADQHARGVAEELMASVLELYGEGLHRVMQLVEEVGPEGTSLRDALVEDGVVASLLLIHDLYPVPLEERVAEALASVQPYMESHGGGVELLGLEGGVARLRLQGSCDGCAASAATLELAIEKALMETAPDLAGIEVEGAAPATGRERRGCPVPRCRWRPRWSQCRVGSGRRGGRPARRGPHLGERGRDGTARGQRERHTAGLPRRVRGLRVLARGRCARRRHPELSLRAAARFDLPRAGRSADATDLQLGPVPLLRDGPDAGASGRDGVRANGNSNIAGGRPRAELVGGLRKLARGSSTRPGAATTETPRDGESCDLCGTSLATDHRHLLQLEERRIDCCCEACWALRSGDAEYRPVGTRTLWLPELELSEERWASFAIPIGLAFFMRSSVAGGVVGLYPSPAGATESELDLGSWDALVEENPILADLESDAEGLVVNRLADPRQYAIAPIDQCYALVGLVKANWEGISGGTGLERAIAGFFDRLRRQAAP